MTFHDSPTDIPDPEVAPKAKRRKFSAEYKRRILEETDNLTEPGQTGALLRREELYSSRSPQVRPTLCANISETTLLDNLGYNVESRGE